ncbi:MAG: alpha-L-fucosidase [Bacteroidales bacterium]|nr:alpha-L-fucosidase [Bacteroidales bacterium]
MDRTTETALHEFRANHFGLFIHFGVYSKLGGIWKGEKIPYYGEQIMNHARIPIAEYEAVAREFNPVDFNADSIVLLAKNAGMKYIVFTTKHHDGFCMFDTQTTDYDIVDFTPYGKDIVRQLADACHRHGMKLGFYYSLPDWHYPHGIPRLEPDTTTNCTEYVNQVYSPLEIITPELEDYIVAQITELLTNYGEIYTMWFDMGLLTPEQSRRFRETVKNIQPQCLINGRIMNNMGDYMTLPDNGNISSYGDIYWDNPASLYNTWGYKSWIERPELSQQIETQTQRLLKTLANGGVFLLNIGPDGTGKVIDYERDVLNGIGKIISSQTDKARLVPTGCQKIIISQRDQEVILSCTDKACLVHPAIDGTGYMSVQPNSWLSWQLDSQISGEYDVFIVYKPENDAKEYTLTCNGVSKTQVLPGVDRMLQTSYFGTLLIKEGPNEIILDQANRCNPLEPLGLQLQKIILRKQ